jgi:4-hydroxybenzoate polyprenyltransferase
LLDLEFDRREGLKSVATRFGERGAFWAARVLHVATVGLLLWVGVLLDIGVLYWVGVAAVAALLIYEHSLVRPDNLRRLDAAFFLVNGIISVTFFAFVLLDAIL